MKLEAEILLNRFRCNAEIARLSNLAEQKQERAGEHRAGGEERHKAALEEIERRVAETIARHKLFTVRSR